MPDHETDPTRRFAELIDDHVETLRDTLDTGSTQAATTLSEDPDALAPDRVRYLLVWFLFAFISVWLAINNYHLFSYKAGIGFAAAWSNGAHYVIDTAPGLDSVEIGDEVVSIDGQVPDARYKFRQIVREFEPGETHLFEMKRDGRPYQVQMQASPVGRDFSVNNILNGLVIPFEFFTLGLLLFLFKPNSRLTVLAAISFALMAASTSPIYFISYAEGAFPIVLIWQIGYFISLLSGVVLLHFMFYFPQPSRFVRRFPRLPVLIYLPFLLYVLPTEIAQQVSWNGIPAFDIFYDWKILNLGDFLYSPYLVADIVVLFANYVDADEPGRRRLRILMAIVPVAILPYVLVDFILPPIEQLLGISLFRSQGLRDFAGNFLMVTIAPVFAYAVVKHRVIPISFIIRRGLQYLFAKNGLRALLLLPLAGIVWNIAARPDRTLSELLFQNSVSFYVLSGAAIAIGLISRYRLNEWIDRRFFREQFDQELLLRRLIENVKASDSMIKLSRLVSSQIQAAMHPSSIHFFYESQRNSDFSVGYTTGENSGRMRLAAGSPLLRFMQDRGSAVDFPLASDHTLDHREVRWLEQLGTRLLVPMHGTDGRLAGFFSLGAKLSEIPYTERDKKLLGTLADQIAIVHENLSLRERVLRDEKIRAEVLARFDENSINLMKECPRCGLCFDRQMTTCTADGRELTFTLPVERTIESRYRLEKLIGRGGMGAVYEAMDLRIGRSVALKILSGSMFGDRAAQRRFEREAQTAGKLNHRNIVTIFDYGVLTTEGAYLVMERVRGKTLATILWQEGKLTPEKTVTWFLQVLDGIEAAHKAGIIHRDLKPDNILVTTEEDGSSRLCILDFGLARYHDSELASSVTVPGTVMGTLGYMPPEQLQGLKVDERTDLFATAVMIYECLYGEKPFAGTTYLEIFRSMTEGIHFDLPGAGHAAFFERGLAREPESRFNSAADMRESLQALVRG